MCEPFDLSMTFNKLNYTPLLSQSFLSPSIDPLELDLSHHLKMKFSPVAMRFKKEVYTYLLRCMDLNMNYTDEKSESFMFYIWN